MTGKNKRQKIDSAKYITVFAITTLVFIIGILVGNYFSSQKLEQVDIIGQDLKTDTVGMELQYEMIAENPCEYMNNTLLSDELWEMASKLDYMESRLGEDDPRVNDLKEYYSLLEIRHWLFIQKTNKECNLTGLPIMFFYTNEDDCKQCKEQGYILTWVKRNYENVYIYSYDHTITNIAIETLKRQYDVTGTPAVVIGKDTYNKFMTKKEIQQILDEKGQKMIQ